MSLPLQRLLQQLPLSVAAVLPASRLYELVREESSSVREGGSISIFYVGFEKREEGNQSQGPITTVSAKVSNLDAVKSDSYLQGD